MPAAGGARTADDVVWGRLRSRALHRAETGRTLTRDEAASLCLARGEDLERLLVAASRVRDAMPGLRAPDGRRRVTYSRKVFVPLTHLCRDACGYCTFAWPPRGDVPAFLAPDEVLAIARAGRDAGCREVLFTLGDRPEARYPTARAWLDARGYDSTLAYLRAVAIQVVEETGLLPHLNPGVLSWQELALLKPVAASMGLMLESTARSLLARGGAHALATTTKDPEVRLRTIEDAGRLAVPFTSGLLVGIGETVGDRADTVLALRASHRRHGHLQEVIVQPFRAKPDTAMRDHPEPSFDDLLATIAMARVVLGPTVSVQAPPNLSPTQEVRMLAAGIDDLGGISPVTPDHVNPEAPWPQLDALADRLDAAGFVLTERLCVYPRHVLRPDPWLHGRMQGPVAALAGPDGLADPAVRPEPHPWQDPDRLAGPRADGELPAVTPSGSAVPEPDADGPPGNGAGADVTADVTADGVHGDVAAVVAGLDLVTAGRPDRRAQPTSARLDRSTAAALAAAQRGGRIDDAVLLPLFSAEGAALEALCAAADEVRAARVGEVVTYVVNRNINFTNVCYTGCRFCAFAQRRDDPDAYELSLAEIGDRAVAAVDAGATEVCLQGGIHPDLPGDHYFRILATIRDRAPTLHVHAFSPMEVVNGASRLGVPLREWLVRAQAAGLGSIPGTAAEILDDEVRWVLTRGKLPTSAWLEVVTTAHELGLPTTSTMMFGHVDEPRHWVAHLQLLREVQEVSLASRAAAFTEFVPLPFVHQLAPLYLAGVARPGPTWEDVRRVHAVARLALAGVIDHVQASWVKVGLARASQLLAGGVDDLGGTLMDETISRMAGADHGVRQRPADLVAAAAAVGRPARQRTTAYGAVLPS